MSNVYAELHRKQSPANLARLSEAHPTEWRRYVRWSIEQGEQAWSLTPNEVGRILDPAASED